MTRFDLPTGTVTFLFTDIEGSTGLLRELGAEAYGAALAEHRRILREAFARHGGIEVDTQGDAFFVAFPTAPGAIGAAADAQEGLASGPIRVRMGIHTGTPHNTDEGYVGQDVHTGARIGAAGHGGQVLLSKETRELVALDVTDLGEHRLKDLPEPMWIFQLGKERFPPLKTISNTNLPRPASSFVGRKSEVSGIVSRLRGGARLVSLTGPGGSGKTRLAIEAASELVPEFRNGVFWVSLAPLRDSALVTETIVQSIGAKDGLAYHVGEREMLLLLDNFEQVMEAAPELSSLLSACPNVRMLVTSREVLRVQGEVELPVPPLAEPEALALFCARTQLEPSDEISELCGHLDNLPLAVELAAARAAVLSPQQILERLSARLDLLKGGRDADPRQQTLRATIDWSYELLSAWERRLFARLAVFAGGCTLESAEEVAGAGIDGLQSLVEKSLVRRTGGRFWMLETIRDFAIEHLEASGEASEMCRRHGAWFLALSERAAPNLHAREAPDWFDRLESEHANLRRALGWFVDRQDADAVLVLAGSLWTLWLTRGYWVEGLRWLEAALRLEGESDPELRIDPLWGAAVLSSWLGDVRGGRRRAEELLALSHEIGSKRGEAIALCNLGIAADDEGDHAAAKRLGKRSVELARQVGDGWLLSVAINNLGDALLREDEFAEAAVLFDESIEVGRAREDLDRLSRSLSNLGFAALGLGDVERAGSLFRQSLDAAWRLRNRDALPYGLLGLAAAVGDREAGRAARLLAQGDLLRKEVGAGPYGGYEQRVYGALVAALRASLGDEGYEVARAAGRAMSPEEALAYAFDGDRSIAKES